MRRHCRTGAAGGELLGQPLAAVGRRLIAAAAAHSPAPAADSAPPRPNPTLPRIETISWSPRAYIFHNFLSQAEADHIVEIVKHTVAGAGAGDRGQGFG